MHIKEWNEEMRRAVERRHAQLVAEPVDSIRREVARVARGLPVYCDIGGCIVIQPSGEIVQYTLDTGTVTSVVDPRWARVGCASAAEEYPEFAALKPRRPFDAMTCPACHGVGVLTELNVRCGTCMGLGWSESGA